MARVSRDRITNPSLYVLSSVQSSWVIFVSSNVPPYFGPMIDAFHQGNHGRFVHLGHWDIPPKHARQVTPAEFEVAQQNLSDTLIDMAHINDHASVLDVGCGFGGTIEQLNQRTTRTQLTGLNIDPRQLAICSTIKPRNHNQLTWIEADACEIPFPPCSFDRLLCIEAMFHFASRACFLSQAARVLRPGGILVASDIVVDWQRLSCHPRADEISKTLIDEYGPWPELCLPPTDFVTAASDNDFHLDVLHDATVNTAPSHDFTAPGPARLVLNPQGKIVSAAHCLKYLHADGLLKYVYLKLIKSNS